MSIDYATLTHLYTCWAKPIDREDYDMSRPASKPNALAADFEIVDEPYPGRITTQSCAYDALFSELRPGRRIKCHPKHVDKVSSALTKWLRRRLIEGISVRTIRCCTDGYGGVWMVFKDSAAAAEYERRKKAAIKTELRPVATHK